MEPYDHQTKYFLRRVLFFFFHSLSNTTPVSRVQKQTVKHILLSLHPSRTMIQSDTCIGHVDCFEVGGSYAAELNSLFTQQPSKGSGPAGAVRLRARFWVVSPERASSRRSVNSLNLFGEEVQHLARHTGGVQVTPASWTRSTDDCDRP